MLPELAMGILPMIGASTGNQRLMRVGQTGAAAQFFLIACSFIILTWAFIAQDFSVEYVPFFRGVGIP
jgi:cytochrome c-type biogenesis protein CcmF